MQRMKAQNHDEYIGAFSGDVQLLLHAMRRAIREAAPQAEEVISYRMPAFKVNGRMLVWFAAHEKHIGFYPGASGIAAFEKDLKLYKHAKGSVQFPIDKPLPLELVKKIVKLRVHEREVAK